MKKVLIGCEESQTVCIEFRKLGFEAYSNDIQDCSGNHPEWHLKMDVFEAIDFMDWDLIILHPPCTKVTCTSNRTYAKGKLRHQERIDSAYWIGSLWKYSVDKCNYVCLENPKGVLNRFNPFMPKPVYIQPYEHGHKDSKMTGLWLSNLPNIVPTEVVSPEWHYPKNGGNRMSKTHAHNPSTNNPKNSKLRSKTYPGIAKAMADQWGQYLLKQN